MIEGPKKIKSTTRAGITTVRPIEVTSPLSRTPTRGNLRTRPQTVPPVRSQETEPATTRVPPTRGTRPTVTRGTRPPVTVSETTREERTRPPRTRGPNTRAPTDRPSVAVSRVRGRPTTQAPTYLPPETITEFSCSDPANENHPRCIKPTTSRPRPPTTRVVPTQPPRRIDTTTKFVCTPGSLDPQCAPDCYLGNRDPRCPQTTVRPTTIVELTTR